MRLLLLFIVCLSISACENGGSYHRGYVISKSQKAEIEPVIEPPAE